KIIIRQYVTSILFYVVGIDNVFLGVRNANNEIPYSVGTLKKIEEP
ncbi:2898_t:CDS:1, partial [Racocetra persica]